MTTNNIQLVQSTYALNVALTEDLKKSTTNRNSLVVASTRCFTILLHITSMGNLCASALATCTKMAGDDSTSSITSTLSPSTNMSDLLTEALVLYKYT